MESNQIQLKQYYELLDQVGCIMVPGCRIWGKYSFLASVMSDSVRPHRWQPTRLPRPWDSPGKNTGVGCHFLLQCMKVKSESEVSQSCPTLSDPMDCSLPGSSVHGIFQARVLEWGAIAFSILIFISVFCNKHEIHCHQRNYLKQHIHSQGMTVQYWTRAFAF